VHFKEIETKYNGDQIKLSDFVTLAKSLTPVRELQAGSYDHYFVRDDDTFIRYRAGAVPELTMKKKMKDTNNFVRVECNLKLDPNQDPIEQRKIVDRFCELLGFGYSFSIYKTCMIFFWERHNLVYYVVYDGEMKEQGRFLEIEMDERHAWDSEEQAWTELLRVEKQMEPIGITPQKRIRRSLFEMFRKVQ
jgi:hypothetical protein